MWTISAVIWMVIGVIHFVKDILKEEDNPHYLICFALAFLSLILGKL